MKKLNQDSSFNIIKYTGGCFSNLSMIVEREYMLFGKNNYSGYPFVKSETTFEKKLLKIVHIFLSLEICFSAALRINFLPFDIFFYERKNNSLPEGSIICDFFCIKAVKVQFFGLP